MAQLSFFTKAAFPAATFMSESNQERIAKLMARRGMCSRREAERLIDAGQVLVDGVVVREQGCKARPDAEIRINPMGAMRLAARLTVMLHKPPGVVSTQAGKGQVPAWKLLRTDTVEGDVDPGVLQRVLAEAATFAVAGRLDRASRGLLVLTQGGTVARRIIGAHEVKKSYVVRTAESVTSEQIRKLRGKVTLDGQPLRPMEVRRLSTQTLHFTLLEGKKHQIRRVCQKVGLTVSDLLREAVGPLKLGDLREGHWRVVSAEELASLLAPVEAR